MNQFNDIHNVILIQKKIVTVDFAAKSEWIPFTFEYFIFFSSRWKINAIIIFLDIGVRIEYVDSNGLNGFIFIFI